MEDLSEVRITQGLFPAGSVQFFLLNTKCIENYGPVLQVTLPREHFTSPIPKDVPPFPYVPPIHCNLPQTPKTLLRLSDWYH